MVIWQADFYRRPLKDASGQPLWELLVCDETRQVEFIAMCPQSQANSTWLIEQLQQVIVTQKPDKIQVFRPQSLSLLETAGKGLGIVVEPYRNTKTLKQWLTERSTQYSQSEYYTAEPYNPVKLEQMPPLPLPDKLWGDSWKFASISAGNLQEFFADRPIPIVQIQDNFLPINIGLASVVAIPGIIINGGKKSMPLARWLEEIRPFAFNYIAGSPNGLILESGLVDRWVMATFEDAEVMDSAKTFEVRKQLAKGLHFLLVQPDDSGMTFTGFWLLQGEIKN
ncbi:Tab2/Atab2 family RNA-binding protein [Planktothrix agardhii]|uniref:Tab2/Atab2 family RNA-binding protein n=1 Tax=Planktothrix agardhii TaxID=1160 RepID=UPI001D0A9945|nr:Tab2/Atab2 family RNA-binding protein [Planktothrix agardhii]MCB8758486.1 Tab2/Atab2 family RNA-binding protein [Planktothrix agardhii 1813]